MVNRYRVRRGLGGKAVLQVLVNGPAFIGGQVDSSIRDLRWCDVDFDRAPALLVDQADVVRLRSPYEPNTQGVPDDRHG